MGGDEHLKVMLLHGFEDALDILDGLVVLDALTHQVSEDPCFTY